MGEVAQENHLRVLDKIFKLVRTDALTQIKTAKNAQEVYEVISRYK